MSKLAAECAPPGSPVPHRTFMIDSYNIHRLLIAGVTVASKFFSDVFYTNSRYAKVGGLPQTELNQLELHFLLLNDFRLVLISNPYLPHLTCRSLFSSVVGLVSPSTRCSGTQSSSYGIRRA